MKDFIELRRILTIIAGQWWVLVILTAIAAVTSLLVSLGQPRVYAATTTLLVGQSRQSSSVNRTDIQTSADVAKTYAEIALRQPVLNAVVETLKVGQSWKGLQQQVRVRTIEGTQLLEVTAEAPSPAAA